ncbi:enhancer of mRNA decapping [Actinomortierella ambigua]|nr:enhancer of mRNA decapping [Actinomortierella ambigua]
MAAAFIGLSVKVLLINGTSLKGHVAHVDPITQKLTLNDVVLETPEDNAVKALKSFSIAGGEIKDLQVLSAQHAPPHAHPPQLRPAPTPTHGHHPEHGYHPPPHFPPSYAQPPVHAPPVPSGPANPILMDPAIISFAHASGPPAAAKSDHTMELITESFASTRISKQSYVDSHAETSANESAPPPRPTAGRRSRRVANQQNHHHHSNYNSNLSDYGSPRLSYQGKRGQKKNKDTTHEWSDRNVADFIEEDFDFQGNLSLFDKARVFAEIRDADDTAPESLLVNLNRNPNRAKDVQQSPMMRKLAPNENVLDPAPKRSPFLTSNNNGGSSATTKGRPVAPNVGDEEDDTDLDDYDSSSGDTPSKEKVKSPKSRRRVVATNSTTATTANGGHHHHHHHHHHHRHHHDGADSDDEEDEEDEDMLHAKKRVIKIQTLAGVSCPIVTSQQMQDAERLSTLEMGLSEEAMVENGGRGTAMMCLQALGGSRRIQPNNHNSAPVVVVLAGNNRTGAYAVCAARHLANHGCQVLTFLAARHLNAGLSKAIHPQVKGFLSTGEQLINTLQDLPGSGLPVDLIVDGLLGYQYSLRDIVDADERETICDLMDWANNNKAPVLSLDLPSGSIVVVSNEDGKGGAAKSSVSKENDGSGVASSILLGGAVTASAAVVKGGNANKKGKTKFCVRPKWTLCLGAPKVGCRSRAVTGELFMTDLGIPCACWKRAGVKGFGLPWGADYLVGLEYI